LRITIKADPLTPPMDSRLFYLAIDLGCVLFPFLFSFDKRTSFYKSWPALGVGILFMMCVFIPWDIAFTNIGIWGFNPTYISGAYLLHLPIEEWLFFICVPYACAFTYVSVGYFFPSNPFSKIERLISYSVMLLSVVLLICFPDKAYTSLTALLTLILIALLTFVIKSKFLGSFYLTYLFIVIPFLLVNGLLTGLDFWKYPIINNQPNSVLDQIVWYNNSENIGLRIFSIPVDDLLYGFLLLLMVITGFEAYRNHQAKSASTA